MVRANPDSFAALKNPDNGGVAYGEYDFECCAFFGHRGHTINACAVPCREAWPRGSACRLNMTADVLTMQRVAARFLSGCRNPLPCPCTERLFNWSRSHISVPGRMNACHPSSGAVTSVLYVGCPRTFTHVQYSASRCNGTQPAKVSIRAGAHTNRRDQKEAVPWQITRSCPSSPTKS